MAIGETMMVCSRPGLVSTQKAFGQPGILAAVEALFLRVLMQSPGPRPSLAIIAGKGVQCTAVIFLGKIPSKFEAHAEATAPVKNNATVRHGEQAYAEATGAGPDGALLALYEHLMNALKLRIMSDLGVWERATGEPWEGLDPTGEVRDSPVG